ncbi:MAG: glycosyltransferase family 2 protein, partial [Tepidiformaceae bacterium]
MSLTVIVPVKDDPRIFACVDSIRAAACDRELEIIVIDNRSSAEFARKLRALDEQGVSVISAEGTVYAARNRGVAASSGDIVLFTDADCTVHPDWMTTALAVISRGSDIAQGLAGSAGDTFRDRVIQARYEAPFRGMRPGTPVLCDTRNFAARRAVLDRVRFEESFRRVGDTELGLRAEALGFRVAFVPEMRVDHQHEPALDVFIAKQVCHGWGAARLMHESPGLPWHGGHLLLTATWLPRLRRLPFHRAAGRLIGRASIA